MRPLSLLLTSLAAATAATARADAAGAQDREPRDDGRVERTRIVTRDGRGVHVWTDEQRGDGPAIGVVLENGGRADTAGVRVAEVLPKSPAEAAGIRAGDRIVAIGDVDLRVSAADAADPMLGSIGERRLRRELGKKKPGDEVALRVVRDGSTRTVRVKTVRDDELRTARRAQSDSALAQWRRRASEEWEKRPALGLSVSATGSRRDTLGLFVSRVVTDGPAEKAGVVEGDRIASINGVDVRVPREDAEDSWAARARANRFTRELQKAKPGDRVTLRVWSGGRWKDVAATAGKASELRAERMGFLVGPDGFEFSGIPPMPPMPPTPPTPPMAPRAPMAPMPPTPPLRFYMPRFDGDDDIIIYRDGERAPRAPRTRALTRSRIVSI